MGYSYLVVVLHHMWFYICFSQKSNRVKVLINQIMSYLCGCCTPSHLCVFFFHWQGQQDDARMNLTLAMSAIREGAACLNYVQVQNLLFNEQTEDGKSFNYTAIYDFILFSLLTQDVHSDFWLFATLIKEIKRKSLFQFFFLKTKNKKLSGSKRVCGARVQNTLTGEEWDIKAKCVINATGPFTDAIRKMDNQDTPEICLPASGIHITLPEYYWYVKHFEQSTENRYDLSFFKV